MNVFEKYAEDASTERMQNLWASVLAGEIRTPKRFSLATLRFISELDSQIAQLWENYAPKVCNGDFIMSSQNIEGKLLEDLLTLQDVGLLRGVGGTLQKIFNFEPPIAVANPPPVLITLLVNQGRSMFIEAARGHKLLIPAILLTKIGKEALGIVKLPFNQAAFEQIIVDIPKVSLKRIFLHNGLGQEQILWQEPTPPAAAG